MAPTEHDTLSSQRRKLVLAGLLTPLVLHPLAAKASGAALPQEVQKYLAQPRLQGSGKLRFLGLHVYDARLWVDSGFRPEAYERTPLALELEYARTLYGRQIAERSLAEMKNLASIDTSSANAWLDELARIIPDVKAGDRITGVALPGESTRFYLNGRAIGQLRDSQFTRLFFGIWLSPRTSEPGLRSSLIGAGRGTS